MNGKGFLLDTNASIQLLKGNVELLSIISGADFISASIISELEYFSFDLTVLTADEHFKRLTLPWKVQLFAAVAL